jgi:8-oxo-dGTP pyrophosphatase MutT (NUDIX family)
MSNKRIAVIPIFKIKGKKNLFLVTSRLSGQWILPTGKYEDLLSHKQVAALEAFEECGVVGSIDKKFCKTISARISNKGPKRKLRLYRMYVDKIHKKWPEKGQRKRILVPLNKLTKWISNKNFAKQLIRFASQ